MEAFGSDRCTIDRTDSPARVVPSTREERPCNEQRGTRRTPLDAMRDDTCSTPDVGVTMKGGPIALAVT